jgi:hypothetical protein
MCPSSAHHKPSLLLLLFFYLLPNDINEAARDIAGDSEKAKRQIQTCDSRCIMWGGRGLKTCMQIDINLAMQIGGTYMIHLQSQSTCASFQSQLQDRERERTREPSQTRAYFLGCSTDKNLLVKLPLYPGSVWGLPGKL